MKINIGLPIDIWNRIADNPLISSALQSAQERQEVNISRIRPIPFPANDAAIARFDAMVRKSDGCWEWAGALGTTGYGKVSIDGVGYCAHRVAYRWNVGDIPAGLLVCHTCDNRKCVRPDHLFLGTPKDNTRDMIAKGRYINGQSRRTHCSQGHSYSDPEHLYVFPGTKRRRCRTCSRAARAARKAESTN